MEEEIMFEIRDYSEHMNQWETQKNLDDKLWNFFVSNVSLQMCFFFMTFFLPVLYAHLHTQLAEQNGRKNLKEP